MRPRILVSAFLLAIALPAAAVDDGAYRLAGTWVQAATLRDLDADRVTDPTGCHLVISAEPVAVLEVCRGWSGAWEGPFEVEQERGRVALEGSGPVRPGGPLGAFGRGGRRRVVLRAGVPNELQIGSDLGARSPEGLHGLYRLDAVRVEKLVAWMERPVEVPDEEVRPVAAKEPEPEEPSQQVAIAQPIAPKPRLCGCGAAEGGLGIGAIWLALAAGRRRRP
ncbi:MAG TPA: hypothetical protein VN033_00045 [Vulgatibacter sp.]|nr:hypothetical protein [Vulgatibacter sp.]